MLGLGRKFSGDLLIMDGGQRTPHELDNTLLELRDGLLDCLPAPLHALEVSQRDLTAAYITRACEKFPGQVGVWDVMACYVVVDCCRGVLADLSQLRRA